MEVVCMVGKKLDLLCFNKLTEEQIQYIRDHFDKESAKIIANTIGTNESYIHRAIRVMNLKGIYIEELYKDEIFLSGSPLRISRYEFSNYGRIRRISDHMKRAATHDSNGNLAVRISFDNDEKVCHLMVARLVARLFKPIDEPDNLYAIRFIDGNKENLHVSNLMWVSRKELFKERCDRNEVHFFGEGSPKAKFTEEQVRLVCKIHKEQNIGAKKIIKLYPELSFAFVNSVLHGITWKHVTSEYGIKAYKNRRTH